MPIEELLERLNSWFEVGSKLPTGATQNDYERRKVVAALLKARRGSSTPLWEVFGGTVRDVLIRIVQLDRPGNQAVAGVDGKGSDFDVSVFSNRDPFLFGALCDRVMATLTAAPGIASSELGVGLAAGKAGRGQ